MTLLSSGFLKFYTLNFFNSNLLFIMDETSVHVELFCMCGVQMVEKSPFKYCFNL